MEENPKLQAFHESLVKSNYGVPDLATFEETLKDPIKSKTFYDALVNDKYEMPDYETFVSDLGLKKKDVSEYGLPSKEVLSDMFSTISKPEEPEVSNRPLDPVNTDLLKTPDLSLKTPELKGPKMESLSETVSAYLSGSRITDREARQEVEKRISEIDTRLKDLPKAEMQTGDIGAGMDALPKTPEYEEKLKLQDERTKLSESLTTPSRAQYLFGKAYNQSLLGLANKIMTGSTIASEDWVKKYDAGTLEDATATALGFMLDAPFFGAMGKVGGKIGEMAARPIVSRVMANSVKKLMASGIEESLAKKLALKGATKIAQGITGSMSSGVALGSYGGVGSALNDWAQPDANFDDIKWGNALKRSAKDFVLGTGVGGLGLASSVISKGANAIENTAGRIGAKAGVATGGLTAESALFAYGGALLDGKNIKDVTAKDFLDTVVLLGVLKAQGAVQKLGNPKEVVADIRKSLSFDPNKPGLGQFAVDINQDDINSLKFAEPETYESAIKKLSTDNTKLADIMKDESIPALLKQKILWGSKGVAMDNVNLYADKIVPEGEFINIYNKEGVLVDRQKASSKQEAEQTALEQGLQLEDNKMQMNSAEPDVDRVKIVSELKSEGVDIPVLLEALDKPVADRTVEESKAVGSYAKKIPKPKKEKKAPEEKVVVQTPEEIAKENELEYQGQQKDENGVPVLDNYKRKDNQANISVPVGSDASVVKAEMEKKSNVAEPDLEAMQKIADEKAGKSTGGDGVFNKQQVIESLLTDVHPDAHEMARKEFASIDKAEFDKMAEQAGFSKMGSYWTMGNVAKDAPIIEAGKEVKAVEEVKKETEVAITKKLDKQSAIKDDKIFKEQKNQLLDDLIGAEDILLGSNKDEVRKMEQESGGKTDQATIDANIQDRYEHKLDALPKEVVSKLNTLGIKIKDGKLVVDVYKDGTVEVGDIRSALRIIDKGFPTRITEPKVPPMAGKPNPKRVAKSWGSVNEAERRVQLAEENLAEANKSSNKGLQKVMQDQLNEAKLAHEEAKKLFSKEVTEPISNEKTNQPDITSGKTEGDNLQAGAGTDVKPVKTEGKAEPSTTESAKQEPVKTEPKKEGIPFKDKTYQSVDEVLDAIDKGDITFEESKQLREDVGKFEDGLKASAKKASDDIGGRIDKGIGDSEKKIQDDINDKNSKLHIKLFPDLLSAGNTALWGQLKKIRDGVGNAIAGQLEKGVKSQNDLIRGATKSFTNLYSGLLRTQADIHGLGGLPGKLEMTGTVKAFAPHRASDLLNTWRDVVHSGPESLRRVLDVLDPDPTFAIEKLSYGDLSLAEKNLYFTLRDMNTWVHETNYANGLISTETYLKNKDVTGASNYIARMYDKFEGDVTMDPAIQEFVNRGNSAYSTKMFTDMYKMREETTEWKKEHAIRDPAYLTAKRVMQTIQNVAIKQYMDLLIQEHPDMVRTLKKGEEMPKGFTKLGASYSWGPFRNKVVANHLVEDFVGFYYQNAITNATYDVMKLLDRTKFTQFYKKYRTVYNPFVQTGNVTGNLFFASIAGINPAQFGKNMIDARNLHTKNPELYDRLLKSGLIGDVGITGEMKPLDPLNTKPKGVLGKLDEFATKAYVGADNLAKIAAYQVFRGQGMTHENAVRRAYDSFQNYATVGKTWDLASKIPLVGPTFVKFQADLQRILLNGMVMTPLTTIGTIMAIKMLGNLSSALSGETEEEQATREGRKGVPRIPVVNIPLSFKVGKSEVNVARYLSPLYLYNRGDSEMELSELSKFMPIQFQQKEEGKMFPLPAFADATWGWLGSVATDKDFRGMSISDPKRTKYTDSNTPTWGTDGLVFNVLNYAARSQLPFYKGSVDIFNAATGQLDYYGRKRTWEQAILNNIVKIQQFDKPELKNYVERNLGYLTSKYASLATKMGDAQGVFYKSLKEAEDKELSPEAQQAVYESASKLRDKSIQKSLDEQIPVYQEIERLTSVYKKWHPEDPFIEENFQNIQAGKNQRFNVLNDVDLQKRYPQEYTLLKKNDMLKKPEVPSYWEGKQLTEDERKNYVNIYWSEYMRNLDSMGLTTQEEMDEAKKTITDMVESTTHPTPDKRTTLQEMATDAASSARDVANSEFRTKKR
jgi:hypothetical protein